ncbi:MAG TPA: aminotransferase class V-fold PLP-dependent enzyme [Terriglobales bacterium]|jgi:selenocysteine lyase/cysteine desulfurase|nr:aminotransferase class V-fold PLP-dependent enzyme [Terriglobales bacterium]
MLDRRRFLGTTAGLAAALAVHARLAAQESASPLRLPAPELYDHDQEKYWAELRELFLLPHDEVYLNNGTNGSSPRPVLRAVFDCYEQTEKMEQTDPEDYPIWGYGPWNEYRDPLAAFVGCSRDELALTRNCTEGDNYIANGIDLKAGDEVLMSDQEHPSGEQPWLLRAKRYGIVVKKFQLPKPPRDAAQILNLVNDAITPRTRVIFLSHITTVTGVVMPVKEICTLARSKGILSALDGAHVIGMMRLNIHELGCDFYASSPHKWLQAPKGTGFLFVRNEQIDRTWSTLTTAGWDDPSLRAERFQRIGSSNVPSLAGLRAAIELANQIGMERIEKRHRQMCDYILGEMVKRGAESWTSPDPALRCAIASVNVPPLQIGDMEATLWKQHKVRIRGGAPSKIRLSTPYYLLKPDIDRFLATFDEYKKAKTA